MSTIRPSGHQIPKADLEALMVYIANLRFPIDDDWYGPRPQADDYSKFIQGLREKTEKYWPALWKPVGKNDIPPVDVIAIEVIRQMRKYLRLFWIASGAENEHARDWYIHRAREYHYRLQISPRVLNEDESKRNRVSEDLLDTPPIRNPIEAALYHLQKRAGRPSTAPRKCPTDDCEQPYFLANKKGQKFCSLECRRPSTLASKRSYANKRRKK
jgi:hypothetical protein